MSIRRDLFYYVASGATLGAALLGSASPCLAQSMANTQPGGATLSTAEHANNSDNNSSAGDLELQ